jgi:TorA maturation chaperone TorD
MSLARLARFREAAYRLVSQAFLYPDEARRSGTAALAAELGRQEAALSRFAIFGEWSRLLSLLTNLDSKDARDVQEIQNGFVSLFAAGAEGVPCPPYESVYREPGGRPSGWLLAEIERDYATVGLALSPDTKEFPDHVSLETEFLAIVCGLEAEAWDDEDLKRGIKVLRKEMAFLDGHLSLWFASFARRVAAADGGGVYAALAAGTEAFISHDRDLVGELVETLSRGGDDT